MLTTLKGFIIPWNLHSFHTRYITITPIKLLYGSLTLANIQLHNPQNNKYAVLNKYKPKSLKQLGEHFDLYLQRYSYEDNTWTNIKLPSGSLPDSINDTTKQDSYYILSAYTKDEVYIGEIDLAYRLYKKGIKPELARIGNTCSIGFCEREQRWYAWARCWTSFGVGSKVNKGDIAYIPNSIENAIEVVREFWLSNNKEVVVKAITNNLLEIELHRMDGSIHIMRQEFRLGRGEWVAQSLDDAKEMASDYIESIIS